MAKVTFSPDIQSISGKLCSKDNVVYAVNKKTGKTYRRDQHEYENPNTELQQTARANFKSRSQAASTWWNANKPSTTNEDGTADYQTLKKLYDAQSKVGNIYCFLLSRMDSDNKIDLGSTTVAAVPSTGEDLEG